MLTIKLDCRQKYRTKLAVMPHLDISWNDYMLLLQLQNDKVLLWGNREIML